MAGANDVRILEGGALRLSRSVHPISVCRRRPSALQGGDLNDNAIILRELLQGRGTVAQQQVVAFNTALVLWVAGVEMDLKAGAQRALGCLAEGRPWERLESLREALNGGEEQ